MILSLCAEHPHQQLAEPVGVTLRARQAVSILIQAHSPDLYIPARLLERLEDSLRDCAALHQFQCENYGIGHILPKVRRNWWGPVGCDLCGQRLDVLESDEEGKTSKKGKRLTPKSYPNLKHFKCV